MRRFCEIVDQKNIPAGTDDDSITKMVVEKIAAAATKVGLRTHILFNEIVQRSQNV